MTVAAGGPRTYLPLIHHSLGLNSRGRPQARRMQIDQRSVVVAEAMIEGFRGLDRESLWAEGNGEVLEEADLSKDH